MRDTGNEVAACLAVTVCQCPCTDFSVLVGQRERILLLHAWMFYNNKLSLLSHSRCFSNATSARGSSSTCLDLEQIAF